MDYYFYSNVSSADWADSNNWWYDASHTSAVGTVPSVTSTDTVYVDSTLDTTNMPSTVDWTMYNNSTIECQGCTITGTFYNNANGFINVYALVSNAGILYNYGTITAAGGEFTNVSTLYNHGSISASSSVFSNVSLLSSTPQGQLYINSPSTNSGTIEGGRFSLFSTFDNIPPGSMSIQTFNSQNGVITNYSGSTIINTGTFNLTTGEIMNSGTVINRGTMTIGSAYIFGTTPAANFTNEAGGVFSYGASYSTRFIGNIFPQVPSSAGFGSAIIF